MYPKISMKFPAIRDVYLLMAKKGHRFPDEGADEMNHEIPSPLSLLQGSALLSCWDAATGAAWHSFPPSHHARGAGDCEVTEQADRAGS